MNYEEILQWIQENIVSIHQSVNEEFTLTYFDKDGVTKEITDISLIGGVLRINNCDLK